MSKHTQAKLPDSTGSLNCSLCSAYRKHPNEIRDEWNNSHKHAAVFNIPLRDGRQRKHCTDYCCVREMHLGLEWGGRLYQCYSQAVEECWIGLSQRHTSSLSFIVKEIPRRYQNCFKRQQWQMRLIMLWWCQCLWFDFDHRANSTFTDSSIIKCRHIIDHWTKATEATSAVISLTYKVQLYVQSLILSLDLSDMRVRYLCMCLTEHAIYE